MAGVKELSARLLYTPCDLKLLSFRSTQELLSAEQGMLGQSKAMDALQFGTEIRRDGYNLFVHGPLGVGKSTMVSRFLEQFGPTNKTPPDLCYVNNFKQANKPLCLTMPPGTAVLLKQHMQNLVDELKNVIPKLFEAEEYHFSVQMVEEKYVGKREKAIAAVETEAHRLNIKLIRTRSGFSLAPVKNDKVISPEEFSLLSRVEKTRYEKNVAVLQERISILLAQDPKLQRELRAELIQLNRQTVTPVVEHLIDEVRQKYAQRTRVLQYLDEVQSDIIDNVPEFIHQDDEKTPYRFSENFHRYTINVLVDHSQTKGAPVVYETIPTYQNLVGKVEHFAQFGTLISDFTHIKPGALHRANGGFLVLDARKVLSQPYAWEGLKQVLSSKEIRIQSLGEMVSLISTVSVEPESVALDVKIILLGDRVLYYLLQSYDPDFSELFKVAVDFDTRIERTAENIKAYAQLIAALVQKQKLMSFSKKAVARLIEFSSRKTEDKEKLSTHMGSISDLLCESDYFARKVKARIVNEQHVQKALDEKERRQDRYRSVVWDEIKSGTIKLSTSGERIGCINGLSVIHMGEFAFGQPSVISASVHMGDGHIVDIEREVDLGGAIHSKGVLILSAYISSYYSRKQPLSFAASIAFEQSYGGVDGDSASVAELCALLSAIAQIPLKQNFSVTGSVNQFGEVQAIGGVNEKIEGFFDVCQLDGLSGEQAVIIPKSNVTHLMLRSDVVEAVKKKQFHVYAIDNVNEALELLCGKKAGARTDAGEFKKGTVNWEIQQKLLEFHQIKQESSK